MTQTAEHPALEGLSQAEAEARLLAEGPNEIPRTARHGLVQIAVDVLRQPMILLLLAAGVIYLVLGDRQEAILLLGSIGLIIVIQLYQERRTEHAVEALRELSSPRALVFRDGVQRRIAGREVVRGDVLIVSEGDRVPADALLLAASSLAADESLLTGESVPVRKTAGRIDEEARPSGGDDQPYLYSGTVVTSGQGRARVLATGTRTELGRIGASLESVAVERTRLQRETDRAVRIMAVIALALCAVVAVGSTLGDGSLLDGLLAGITLAMALVPEEFPVVLTVFLALGAWRIARNNVLTRRVPAIEALGAATVLCVDKTGTLTRNRMSVVRLVVRDADHVVSDEPLPDPVWRLAELAALASHPDPFDPMERAIHEADRRRSPEGTPRGQPPRALVRAYPLSDRLLAMTHVWGASGEGGYVVAAKGAPEAIFSMSSLDEADRRRWSARAQEMAEAGLRVLGVAEANASGDAPLPDTQESFSFVFAGLVGLADPVRGTVPAAVAECHGAGIRVVMLTGDYPATARSIGKQVGIVPIDPLITGDMIEQLDDVALEARADEASIFARVRPEQKLRLVRALKNRGQIVAMTGDGVNDAPALRAADIGIAMGERGTDVAREAAALVLLDDDFSSIVRAIRLGRRIFGNLRKAMTFLVAVHVPIAGLSVLPIFLGWPLVLLPVHVVFLELIIDPVCSIAFESEPEEADTMRRPPRPVAEPIFDRPTLIVSLLQGFGVLLVTVGVMTQAVVEGMPEADVRALTFVTLVVADLGLILANRSGSGSILRAIGTRNPALWLLVAGAATVLALVVTVPLLRDLFSMGELRPEQLLKVAAASALVLVWLDLVRLLRRTLERRKTARE